jgi:hypothetical protein
MHRVAPFISPVLLGFLSLANLSCDQPASSHAPPSATASSASTTATAQPAGARPPSPEALDATRDAARKITASILIGGQALKTLTELTDTIGPRLTGTDAHKRAAAWAADRFRSYGVDAALETFTLAHSWTRGETTGKVTGPREVPLHVASYGWTPGTPVEGVRGEVFKLDDLSLESIEKHKADVKGKVAYYDGMAGRKARLVRPAWRLGDAGAVAVLVRAGHLSNAVSMGSCAGPKEVACKAPVIVVGQEDGATIERMLGDGAVSVQLASTAQLGGPEEVPNVVAEIKGREIPEEMVLVGAHLDSWDLATGAQDNGSGSVQVLEAARAIRALGTAPRRTMRFLLWAGEEEGLFGSRAYVKTHASELDHVVAYLNTDYGAGQPLGWDLDGREDVVTAMKPLAKSLLAGLGADELETKLRCDTDHCPFWLRGVPTLNLDVDISKYDDIHHLSSDTIDKVKAGSLSAGAAAIAVAAYAIAELPERIAPRIDHATIAKHLKGNELLPSLIDSGEWVP